MVRIVPFSAIEEKECGALGRKECSDYRFIYEKKISK